MSSDNIVWVLTQQFAMQAPTIIVCLAGIIFAAATISRNPLPSLMAGGALGLMLFGIVAGTITTTAIIRGDFSDHENMQSMLRAVGLVRAVIYSVALATLVAAVYVGRSRK